MAMPSCPLFALAAELWRQVYSMRDQALSKTQFSALAGVCGGIAEFSGGMRRQLA